MNISRHEYNTLIQNGIKLLFRNVTLMHGKLILHNSTNSKNNTSSNLSIKINLTKDSSRFRYKDTLWFQDTNKD